MALFVWIISRQSAVLFSQNKSTPAEQAVHKQMKKANNIANCLHTSSKAKETQTLGREKGNERERRRHL
jgi:hypothetical protein